MTAAGLLREGVFKKKKKKPTEDMNNEYKWAGTLCKSPEVET